MFSNGRVNEKSIMIGDRAVDILAAHANGLTAAGVLWGYGSENELSEAGAAIIIEDVAELAQLPGLKSPRR